jgi:hypothetical protein
LYEIEKDREVFVGLLNASIVCEVWPVRIDKGDAMVEPGWDVIELFIENDALKVLAKLGKIVKGKNFEVEFGRVCSELGGLVRNWKEMWRLVVKFTLEEFLTEELKGVRSKLIAFCTGK